MISEIISGWLNTFLKFQPPLGTNFRKMKNYLVSTFLTRRDRWACFWIGQFSPNSLHQYIEAYKICPIFELFQALHTIRRWLFLIYNRFESYLWRKFKGNTDKILFLGSPPEEIQIHRSHKQTIFLGWLKHQPHQGYQIFLHPQITTTISPSLKMVKFPYDFRAPFDLFL